MKHILGAIRRTSYGAGAALFLVAALVAVVPAKSASAGTLTERSMQLSSSIPNILPATPKTAGGIDNAPAGSAANGNKVSHTYIFEAETASQIQAIQFQYCNGPFGYLAFAPTTSGTCTAPAGFDSDLAPDGLVEVSTTPDFASVEDSATFTVNTTPTTTNVLVIENSATGVTTSNTNGYFVRVTFTATDSRYFTNPSASYVDFGGAPGGSNKTFFAHIETYDAPAEVNTASLLDEGTVASSIANQVNINTRVQETLKFSVGTTNTTPTATCVPVTGTEALLLGDSNNALAADQQYDVTSYFRISTNASSGANVLYSGRTLTSTAGDTIDAIGATATAGQTAEEQFGITMDTTAAPLDQLTAIAPFDNEALYAFETSSDTAPEIIAASTGFITCETGAVNYIANIANDTEAGLYSTKIAYIAVPTY